MINLKISNILRKHISENICVVYLHDLRIIILFFGSRDYFLRDFAYSGKRCVERVLQSAIFRKFLRKYLNILSRPVRRCLQLRWHHKCSRISLEWRMRLSLVTIFREGRYTYAMHLCQHEIIPTVKSIFNFDNVDSIATELINL